jgi:hypothetical protein
MNNYLLKQYFFVLSVFFFFNSFSQVTLEKEVKITDLGLHFDGSKVSSGTSNSGDNAPYDFFFGRSISAHGDAVKAFGNYVFMTWYKGGKANRHLMLSRYNSFVI